jgi:geranylgeranyl diphosphate synthase, type II
MLTDTLKETLLQGQQAADAALERLLPPAEQHPSSIHQAMRHSVFAGGKRLRPILCMESARMIDGALPEGVAELGAAIEMLHTYSLVHDDLPALDNDDLRRGRPTCHKAFGEATAILAGDALQTRAYEIMARLRCPADARVHIIEELAHGTGTIEGMIGGQVVDLESEHLRPNPETLEYIHRAKTGALIVSSLLTGCYYAGATALEVERVRRFGTSAGLAFQIADDILDVTQTSEQLGKTAGKDLAAEKVTYPAMFGLDKAADMANQLITTACAALDGFGQRANTLKEIAHYLVDRKK